MAKRLSYFAGPRSFVKSTGGEGAAPIQARPGLKSRTLTNGLVTAAAQAVQLAVTIASTVVLARLLAPGDFGIVAIVLSFAGFFRVFNDMGLSTATIQQAEITPAQVSNLFWINLGSGALITCTLALLSPLVAWFFHEPRLTAVTTILSFSFLLSSSTVQHLAVLKRQMLFGKIAIIQVASLVGAVCLGIAMALGGFGYWSLVAMQLCNPLLTCAMTWVISDWRPQLPKRRSGTRSLLDFGVRLAVSNFIWSVARGSDTLLIGKIFGTAPLGFYSRAAALLSRPIAQVMSPIEAVMVPTLSRLLPDPERYRRAVLELYEIIALGTFFFSGLIFALSRPLILVLLGSKWQETIPIFAGFSLLSLYIPVAGVGSWLLTSQGRGKDVLRLSVIGSILTACAFGVGLIFGPAGVATGYSLSCLFLCLPLIYYLCGREGPVRTIDLWRRFFTHAPVWLVACGSTFLFQWIVRDWPVLLRFSLSCTAGVIIAGTFVLIFSPSRRVVRGMRQNLLQWKASLFSGKRSV